ncbi:MAG: glycoside hydrolase family 43 protein [Abditibacteriota bacterium]|nr:glycoside hydrolase family 43 protein [Abditibacteriota bacterium]
MKKTAALIVILISLCAAVQADYGVSKFVNPICGAADPCIVKNPDGPGYYYVYSTDEAIYSEFALSPADFKWSRSNVIFEADPDSDCRYQIWAPELHRIGGKWYIYFCAYGTDETGRRLFVISGDDPMKPFGDRKRIGGPKYAGDKTDIHGIDETVFEYKGKLYTVYSGFDGGSPFQRLLMAEMESPTAMKDGKWVPISKPEYDWEQLHGKPVNEGPAVLRRNGRLYIIYSCSYAASDDYRMGVLEFTGGDIMDPANWKKHPKPILVGRGEMQGTGHCTFTQDADGKVWCVFHCNRPHSPEQPFGWVNRYLCLQPVVWVDDFPTLSPVLETPKYFKYEK